MDSVGGVLSSTNTLSPTITLPLVGPLQQQPNMQLLLLQILTQLQNLELGQNHCKRAQIDLNHTTDKYRNAQQRWAELEEDFTVEINSLRQKQANCIILQEEIRHCQEELKMSQSSITNLKQEKEILSLQLENEKSTRQNEIWNKTLGLAERFLTNMEEKRKCLTPDSQTTGTSTGIEEQAKITALENQLKMNQGQIEQLKSEKKTVEELCQAEKESIKIKAAAEQKAKITALENQLKEKQARIEQLESQIIPVPDTKTAAEQEAKITALENQVKEKQARIEQLESQIKPVPETKPQYPVFGEATLSKIVRYCDRCDITRTLFAAVKANNAEVTLALLKNGADPNAVDGGRTPLIWAAEKGNNEAGAVLLKNGANTEARVLGDHSKAALHFCAQHGHVEFCRLLLDHGAEIDSLDTYKQNAIYWAGWLGHVEVAKLLVERGTNIKLKNHANRTVRQNSRANVANWLATVEK